MEEGKKTRGRKPLSASQRAEKEKYGFALKPEIKARRKQLEEALNRYQKFTENCRQALDNLGIDDVLDMIKNLPSEQRQKLKGML